MLNQFDLSHVRVLHIEPTTVCNASCPQCARENPAFYQDSVHRSEIKLSNIDQLWPVENIPLLEKMFMCGNFGEPAAAQDTVAIYKYFRQHNPNIVLGMNTNGSLRNPAWWQELAEVFDQKYDYVVFSIDGLEDTNHIYRRNTVWSKIMENAQAFIDAGGSAHWDMLIYEHNQHQVQLAQDLAKNMGFSWFRAKVSKRFVSTPVEFLKPPLGYALPNVNDSAGPINCHALNEHSIYIAADGSRLPCCWFGAEVFCLDQSAQHLLQDWNQRLVPSWQSSPHRICDTNCKSDLEGTSFSKQWQIEQQLK